MAYPGLILYWLVIAGVVVGESLLILWAATSNRPRLLRAIVVWISIVMLMAIDAKMPALVFTVTAAMTWAIIAGVQRLLGVAERGWRFQLGDLLVAILFVGTLFALLRDADFAPLRMLVLLTLFGLPLAPVIAFAHLSVTGPSRHRMVGASLLSITVSILVLMTMRVDHVLQIWIPDDLSPDERRAAAMHIVWLMSLVVCVVMAVVGMQQLTNRNSHASLAKRWGYGVLVAVSSVIAVVLVTHYSDHLWIDGPDDRVWELQFILLLGAPIFAVALIVATVTWLVRSPCGEASVARRRLWGRMAAGGVIATAAPLAWLYWQLLWPVPFPPPPPGEPNHYARIAVLCHELSEIYAQWRRDDRVAAGNFDYEKLPSGIGPRVEELVPLLLAPNFVPTEALEASALRQHESSATIVDFDGQIFRSCLHAIENDARKRKDSDAYIDYAIAKFRFAELRARGGTFADLDSDRNALQLLVSRRKQASLAKVKEVIDVLEQTLAERESLEILVARSRVRHQRQQLWQGRLQATLARFGGFAEVAPSERNAYFSSELAVRSVQILYAMRLFQEEHRRLPASLDELTPTIMTSVPLDPYSGKPLVYRPELISYKLYSVGPNGRDDGGKGDDIDLSWGPYQY